MQRACNGNLFQFVYYLRVQGVISHGRVLRSCFVCFVRFQPGRLKIDIIFVGKTQNAESKLNVT